MSFASWKSALRGFLICAIAIFSIYAWLYLAAPDLAEGYVWGIAGGAAETKAERNWLLEYLRTVARDVAAFLTSVSCIYWFFSGLFGKGAIASIWSANVLLIGAGGAFLIAVLNSYYGWAETFCDQLPFAHTGFQITKINECPSSSIFFSALQLVALLLVLVSLMIRILISRKRAKGG